MGGTRYQVRVGDNFHMFDESHVGTHSTFETVRAAVEACERIVDEFLTSAYKPGITPDELLRTYAMFGASPFVLAADKSSVAFSAWDYAAKRSDAICQPKIGPHA